MRLNQSTHTYTHEGAKAKQINPESALKRSLLSCFLWEREFYEDGESIATRLHTLADQCTVEVVAQLAIEARLAFKLRHAPLWLTLSLIKRGGPLVADTIYQVVNRPDELSELVVMYWKDGKKPLSAQMKKGLAKAFTKFSEYQFAKWDRPYAVKLRDVMFLVHPKAKDKEQQAVFDKLANKALSPPNTWESRMAAGEDKHDVFTDLLKTEKLGYMALLRNLRNMVDAQVDRHLVEKAILKPSASVLPYRFIAAAKAAPSFERQLDEAMLKMLESMNKLNGHTVLLVDVSVSMSWALSSKSDLRRIDAANGLAILLSGICEQLRVMTFSNQVVEVPARKGMALGDAIWHSQANGGTLLGKAVMTIDKECDYDRLIVLTDEQSQDPVPDPNGRAYMINVASNRNGVGYGAWTHIDGFSEACIEFIQQIETADH